MKPMKCLRTIAAFLMMCAACSWAAETSATRDLSNDDKAVKILREVEQLYEPVKSITGELSQSRQDPVAGKIDSHAKFYILKPNNFRVDYESPHQSTSLITKEKLYRYTPEASQVECYTFKKGERNVQDVNYVLLGFGAKTDELLRVYSVKSLDKGVAKGYYGIQLVPIDKEKANFKYVTILVTDDGKYLPAQFSMLELSGARVTANIDLKKLNMGAPENPARFEPNFPRNAHIVNY